MRSNTLGVRGDFMDDKTVRRRTNLKFDRFRVAAEPKRLAKAINRMYIAWPFFSGYSRRSAREGGQTRNKKKGKGKKEKGKMQ